MTELRPADEQAHPPGASSAWTETWEWRLVVPDASLAVVVAVVLHPSDRRVSYLAAILGENRPTVGVVEHDIAAPRPGSLELRASGLWSDHICEQPFSHWTLGLEAFGLAYEHAADAVGHGRGDLTPAGFDLEWEDDVAPTALADGSGYLTAGRAHGEVLVGVDQIDVDAAHGYRLHRWGTGPRLPSWWGSGDEVGDGASPVRPDDEVALAIADDDAGGTVEWILVADRPNRVPQGASIVSRPWRHRGR